jgi:hypothetical protein
MMEQDSRPLRGKLKWGSLRLSEIFVFQGYGKRYINPALFIEYVKMVFLPNMAHVWAGIIRLQEVRPTDRQLSHHVRDDERGHVYTADHEERGHRMSPRAQALQSHALPRP